MPDEYDHLRESADEERRRYRPRVLPHFDLATDLKVCAHCGADISERRYSARFCSDQCRHIAKAQRQRRGYAMKGEK